MFAAAGVRAARTWRTTLRPRRGEAAIGAADGSAAHQPPSERFLRKSLLAPGEWERVCSSSADPAANALAASVLRSESGPIGARLPPVGPHRKPLGDVVPGRQGAVASFGAGASATRRRGVLRAKQGQSLLLGIQQRADQVAALSELRSEARAVAKARQRLAYAQRSLGVTDEEMHAPTHV